MLGVNLYSFVSKRSQREADGKPLVVELRTQTCKTQPHGVNIAIFLEVGSHFVHLLFLSTAQPFPCISIADRKHCGEEWQSAWPSAPSHVRCVQGDNPPSQSRKHWPHWCTVVKEPFSGKKKKKKETVADFEDPRNGRSTK